MIYEVFLSASIGVTWLSFFFANKRTLHGRHYIHKGIHKDMFILFYLNGIIFSYLLSYVYKSTLGVKLLSVHLFRRAYESAMYTYGHHSKMTVIQFIFGIVYYPVVIFYVYTEKERPIYSLFIIATIIQILSHYILFRKRIFTYYTHYITEALIHYSITQERLNLAWIVTFTLINILNRRSIQNNNPINDHTNNPETITQKDTKGNKDKEISKKNKEVSKKNKKNKEVSKKNKKNN
ncbi:hypothetical protein NEOKW01_1271 [Nematocida sp. AWRm80]|nr:hypothetical protein NEOKW01_1271 [Nematocida sp. AWRm80]